MKNAGTKLNKGDRVALSRIAAYGLGTMGGVVINTGHGSNGPCALVRLDAGKNRPAVCRWFDVADLTRVQTFDEMVTHDGTRLPAPNPFELAMAGVNLNPNGDA